MSMGCRHSWTSGEKSVFLRGPRQVPVFAATAASAAAGAAPTMTLMPDKAQTLTLKGAAAGGDAATAAAGLWVKLNAGQPCPLRVKCVPDKDDAPALAVTVTRGRSAATFSRDASSLPRWLCYAAAFFLPDTSSLPRSRSPDEMIPALVVTVTLRC